MHFCDASTYVKWLGEKIAIFSITYIYYELNFLRTFSGLVIYLKMQIRNLVNKRASEFILWVQYMFPQDSVPPAHQMSGSILEEGVLIADPDEVHVAATPLIRDTRQMRVSLLTILANNLTFVILVLLQVPLRVVVSIDVYLSESIVSSRLVDALMYTTFQPRH